MKVQAKVSSKLIVEVEADSQRAMVEELAMVYDIFGNDTCGKCKNNNTRFVVRNAKDKDGNPVKYYSVDCMDCHARLSVGQHRADPDELFIRRKLKNGEWIVNNGWAKWDKETQTNI